MLPTIKKEKSLSFYSKSASQTLSDISRLQTIGSSVISSAAGAHYGMITNSFNEQYKMITDSLIARRIELNNTVSDRMAVDYSYKGSRHAGVDLAWRYEKADIQMGGTGSANWNAEQRQEILEHGTVRGAEGHHQKNVANHGELQANPDNIKFYKGREEHLHEGHEGNWQNESDAELIDKTAMLENTNRERVFLNEIKGAGISAAIGAGIGFTISAIVGFARSGIAAADIDSILTDSIKAGIETGAISAVTYSAGRFASSILQNCGVNILSNTGYVINFASTGILSIVTVSIYQYMKFRMKGVDSDVALSQIGKQAKFSLSVLTVSIIAQGAYGGHAGIIVSTAIGLIFLTGNVLSTVHDRKIEEKLRTYAIEQYKPVFLVHKGGVNEITL